MNLAQRVESRLLASSEIDADSCDVKGPDPTSTPLTVTLKFPPSHEVDDCQAWALAITAKVEEIVGGFVNLEDFRCSSPDEEKRTFEGDSLNVDLAQSVVRVTVIAAFMDAEG